MSHSNGKITAPINLDGDVFATLGIGSVGGDYDLGYACANTHGKINPWARYKPVRYESLAPGPDENGGKDGMETVVSSLSKWQDTGMRQNTLMEA